MKFPSGPRLISVGALLILALTLLPLNAGLAPLPTAHAATHHMRIDCSKTTSFCRDVYDSEQVFGKGVYVGHDEPDHAFLSDHPGSGNRMRYQLTLPQDPPLAPPAGTFNFQLHPLFWFGMILCDTESYPEQVHTCAPDSDSNIFNNPDPRAPDYIGHHPGAAFLEVQFYPPGWVQAPTGRSCDSVKWCAAVLIITLAQDPINGTELNQTCANFVGSALYGNYAFITRNGRAQAPANPVDATNESYTPDPARDLFMNAGDQIVLTMHDSAHGLFVGINDQTTHQSGSMTASAQNGFGHVHYEPFGSSCHNIPYDFHPMYSTSTEQTRLLWGATPENVMFSDEIGHFAYCSAVDASGVCVGNEGLGARSRPADGDDTFCFTTPPAGCLDENTGFDGVSYLPDWPDGDTLHHARPILFTSPLTGEDYNINYSQTVFETNLPLSEATCNTSTGAGCTLIPKTDDGTLAAFYPFYSMGHRGNRCVWLFGNDVPGLTERNFDKVQQYGSLFFLPFLVFGGHGRTAPKADAFRHAQANPCLETEPVDNTLQQT